MRIFLKIIAYFGITLVAILDIGVTSAASKAPPLFSEFDKKISSGLTGKGKLESVDGHREWEVEFDGYSLPILTIQKGKRLDVVVLPLDARIFSPTGEVSNHSSWTLEGGPCLVVQVRPSEGFGIVESVATHQKIDGSELKCPGPRARQGSYLMRFVDQLARIFSLKKVELRDSSELFCRTKKRSTSVMMTEFLSLTQGQSWFSRLGYQPRVHQREEFFRAADELRSLPLEVISRALHQISSKQLQFAVAGLIAQGERLRESFQLALVKDSFEYLSQFERRRSLFDHWVQHFRVSTSQVGGTLGDFTGWLYQSNSSGCVQVSEILALVLPKKGQVFLRGNVPTRWDWPENSFSWYPSYVSFVLNGLILEKEFSLNSVEK
jgi:hypothetical protein